MQHNECLADITISVDSYVMFEDLLLLPGYTINLNEYA